MPLTNIFLPNLIQIGNSYLCNCLLCRFLVKNSTKDKVLTIEDEIGSNNLVDDQF